ncbi:MAG: hypothetical protein QG588_651, partial [Candidatus Poribacteria bacterium]|nr:hypothetical protein [Candidatus Poribacteria bacterium]
MKKTVLILMALVLVLVGILFWQKNNTSQITNTLQQKINSLQNQIANLQGKSSNPTGGIITTDSDEPAGWKTFANNDYGFTIDYPGNWIVKSITQSSTQQGEEVVIQNLPEVNLGTSDLSLKVEGSFFQVEMYKTKSEDKTIRDWINSGDIPQSVKQDRLKQIVNMFIAGENREVWTNS